MTAADYQQVATVVFCNNRGVPPTPPPDRASRILEELGELIRHLSRISGGPEEGPAMTSTQRLALFEIGQAGPLRLNDLAQRMGISAPTASRAVDALESHDLVERLTDPDDRRALRIDLTRGGRARLERRKQCTLEAFAPAVSALTVREQEQLAELLTRLARELA